MPQLDQYAYVSEVLWLVVLFMGLYIVILRVFLPRMYKVLKFRKKKIILIREKVLKVEDENFLSGEILDKVLEKIVKRISRVMEVSTKLVDKLVLGITKEEGKKVVYSKLGLEKDILDGLVFRKEIEESSYITKKVV